MRRILHLMLAGGLLASLFAGTALSGFAQDEPSEPNENFAYTAAFLPWVPNGVALDEDSSYQGAVTIQNIESQPVDAWVYVGQGGKFDPDDEVDGRRDWYLAESLQLAANESITVDAETLGIEEGEGSSVLIEAAHVEHPFCNIEFFSTECDEIDSETFPMPARIAAQVKNVSPTPSSDGTTNESHDSVDGYSALNVEQIQGEDGTHVLPIVQNNSGWETTIRVASFGDYSHDDDSLENVSVTLYGSGEQGFAGESEVVNLQIRPGGVASFDLSDYVPEDFVGSAFITSSVPTGAIAERSKAEENMLVTNVSRPEAIAADEAGGDGYTLHAPLVFKQYNEWNTGIAVANTDPNRSNSVTVSYYGPTNNVVGQDTLTIPPRGMEFIYSPGTQDLGLEDGFVGSARIEGTTTFHAAVDQVKYFGNDPDVGQAMSYVLDHNIARYWDNEDVSGDDPQALQEEFGTGDILSLPLAQKGNPDTGSGDTSGIQLFNTSASDSVEVAVTFFGANGLPVAPTVSDNEASPMIVRLGANQSYTVYTHDQTEMSAGFQGSATVEITGGNGGVVGVSNNVNYDVGGDGSTAFNMVSAFPIWDYFEDLLDEACEQNPGLCDAQIAEGEAE